MAAGDCPRSKRQDAHLPIRQQHLPTSLTALRWALGSTLRVRHIVDINAARARCFLTSRGASARKNSKRGVLAASFEATSSTLHGRDGKAVYINRYIAPWTFDRNEIQAELKQISSKLGERPREMRLPPREGVQSAIIAVWGKIQLTELDADAISILASGESPRKGCSSTIWATSGDRRSKGFPSTASMGEQATSGRPVLAATMSVISKFWRLTLPHYRPQQLHPRHQLRSQRRARQAKLRRWKPQQPRSQTRRSNLLPSSLSNARLDAGGATTEVQEAAAPEADKIAPLLARPEADLAAAAAKSRLMEKLAYWAAGGLVALLMIVASLLLLWRKRASATKAHVKSETQPARLAVRDQASQAQSTAPKMLEGSERGPMSLPYHEDAVVADAILLQNRKKQKQDLNDESRGQKQEAQLVAVNDKKNDSCATTFGGCRSPARTAIAKSPKTTNSAYIAGRRSSLKKRASTSMLCSSCRQEIGTSDKFCRHCGASSSATDSHVDEVAASTRTSVKKKKRIRKRAREPIATGGHSDTARGPATLQREPAANIAGPIDEADPDGKRPCV